MSMADAFRQAAAAEAQEDAAASDAADKHAARAHYYENVSAFTGKVARGAGTVAKTLADVGGAESHGIMRGLGAAEQFGKASIMEGPGAEYARQMMGPEQEGMYEDAPWLLKHGRTLTTAAWGGFEQALWGVTAGPLGRALQPISRFLPAGLAPVIREAIVNGSLSGGATALQERLKGERIHNLTEPIALGGIIGAIAGRLSPEDTQLVANNIDAFQPHMATYQQSIRDMQRVSQRMAASERGQPAAFMQRLARFTTGSGDNAMAAKVRLLARDEPELFKTPLMKRVLDAAGSEDAGVAKPAAPLPKADDLNKAFNWPKLSGQVVAHEGGMPQGRIGPLGVPVEPPPVVKEKPAIPPAPDDIRKHLETLMSWDGVTEPKADSPIIASRKAISQLAVSGALKPSDVTLGDHATRVARSLFRTAREIERGGAKDESFTSHFETAKEWQRRARALDAAPAIQEGEVDGASASELGELKEHLDKGEPKEKVASGPSKKKVTKKFMEERAKETPTGPRTLTAEEKAVLEIETAQPGIDYYSLGYELQKRGLHSGKVDVPGPDMERWRGMLEDIKAKRLTKEGRTIEGKKTGRFC